MRSDFQGTALLKLFCFTQKIKEQWHEVHKNIAFQKLRFAVNFEGIFKVIFHHLFIPVDMASLTVAYDRLIQLSSAYWLQ
jgi:hypothetical protein